MALISCPHCGKQVSDKSEVCVHCGEKLVVVPQETKEVNFDKLNTSKQQAIFAEFISAYPEHDYGEAGSRQIVHAVYYTLFLFACFLLGFLIIVFISPSNPAVLIIMMPAILFVIVSFCLGVSFYRYNRKVLISIKVFQKWLKEKKGLIYIPKLAGKKQQKIFDEINMASYPLR